MKHKLKLTLVALLLILCVKAHSQVNLQEGSFHLSAKDFGLIERTYSSRSLHQGFFGFGWCSILEIKQNKYCDLQTNPFPNIKMKFNAEGQITAWGPPSKEITLLYNNNRPIELKTQSLRFSIDWEGNRIVRISRSPLHRIEYTYQKNNLIRFSGLNPAELEYDDHHNLIALVSTKTAMKIKYSEIQDTVSEIKGLTQCFESYKFTPEDYFGLKFKAEVFEVCPSSTKLKTRVDFNYEKQSSGNLRLVSAKLFKNETKLASGGPE